MSNLPTEQTVCDSRPDTLLHIMKVRSYLDKMIVELIRRGQNHDQSKLEEPEKSAFDAATAGLSKLTYGSPEYKAELERLKPALTHHYARNTHHPEHYPNGICGMNLLDVVEMLCDWKASSLRQNDGNIRMSINRAQERFKFTDELKQILVNTIPFLGE